MMHVSVSTEVTRRREQGAAADTYHGVESADRSQKSVQVLGPARRRFAQQRGRPAHRPEEAGIQRKRSHCSRASRHARSLWQPQSAKDFESGFSERAPSWMRPAPEDGRERERKDGLLAWKPWGSRAQRRTRLKLGDSLFSSAFSSYIPARSASTFKSPALRLRLLS